MSRQCMAMFTMFDVQVLLKFLQECDFYNKIYTGFVRMFYAIFVLFNNVYVRRMGR